MTKIHAGVPVTLGSPSQEEAAIADVAGKTQLFSNGTTTPPPEPHSVHTDSNGTPNTNGVNGDKEKEKSTSQHSIVGKTYEHMKEMVLDAKEAIAQGEPHVAFSASS